MITLILFLFCMIVFYLFILIQHRIKRELFYHRAGERYWTLYFFNFIIFIWNCMEINYGELATMGL